MTKLDAATTLDLPKLRREAKKTIDQTAENMRIKADRLTPGDGQQQEYRRTLEEAEALQNDSSPQEADYPMLVAERDAQVESGADNSATLSSVANEVISLSQSWTDPLGASIKKERRKGKMLVDLAQDPPAIESARDNAVATIEKI